MTIVNPLITLALLAISCYAHASELAEQKTHETLALEFISLHTDYKKLSGIFDDESIVMARQYETRYHMHHNKHLSHTDVIALSLFFREKLEQVIPPKAIQTKLADSVLKSTTVEELSTINAFLTSPEGKKLSALRKELIAHAGTTLEQLMRSNLTNERLKSIRAEVEIKFPHITFPWGD